MKARIKTTGEIVEIDQCSILYDDGRRELMYGKELEEVQGAPDYWERLKHQYAGMAMQAILLFYGNAKVDDDYCAEEAKYYAHALVEKLKNE